MIAVFCLVAAAAVYISAPAEIVVNDKTLRNVRYLSDIGPQYLEQYYPETHLFKDENLNRKYVDTSCHIKENVNSFTFLLHKFSRNSYHATISCRADIQGIKQYIDDYNRTGRNAVEPSLIYNKDTGHYALKKGKKGTKLDKNRLLAAINEKKSMIDPSDYIVEPEKSDEELKIKCNEINRTLDWHITYTDGTMIRYKPSDIKVNRKTGSYKVKNKNFSTELKELDNSYGETGKGATALLHTGKKKHINGGTWAYLTNSRKEREHINEMFRNLTSEENRKPIMNPRDYKGVIVEVDKSKQHVWVYNDKGKQIMDSPCVTGTKGVHDTPSGVFRLSEVRKNYVMHGQNNDGSWYDSPCKRFMRLTNRGVALHDASWRSTFGGKIYETHGSHGCINLPSAFALKLADRVKPGVMVIVHEH